MSDKKKMTDEERLELAKKLDQELDDFIDGLEKKRYTDGWHEDRWEEEMAKHPFFMKSTSGSEELPPLAQGLANLKYDPCENTPLELAENYKEDGNFNFKHKNYRLAILGYTEGIKVNCDDPKMQASLYNNRSAAHYQLKNYRSALADAESALKYEPHHKKAKARAAHCLYHVKQNDKCIKYCGEILKSDSANQDIRNLMSDAMKGFQKQQRDERKKDRVTKKHEGEKDTLLKLIKVRGIRISNVEDEDDLDLSKLEPCLPGAVKMMVHVENGVLRWPVLILYPEFGTTDFIQNCPEDVPLGQQLDQLYPAPWDQDNSYTISAINVYFEGWDKKVHPVDIQKNLGDILKQCYFELRAGTPAFYVLVRGSDSEKQFLQSHS